MLRSCFRRRAQGLSLYGVVGLVGTATHYIVLTGLVEWIGIEASRAAFIGASVGALVNYCLNYRITFASRAAHRVALSRFLTVAVANAALSAAAVRFGALVDLPYLVCQVLRLSEYGAAR